MLCLRDYLCCLLQKVRVELTEGSGQIGSFVKSSIPLSDEEDAFQEMQ